MNIGAAPLVVRASALSPSPPYHVTIKALRTYNLSGGLLCLFSILNHSHLNNLFDSYCIA